MSINKKILVTIILLTPTILKLKTSAMQQDIESISSEIEMMNEKQKEIPLTILKEFKEFFTNNYEILSIYCLKKPFSENINIEKYLDKINEEEKKYNLFFENIKDRYEEEYQKLNLEITDIINKIKKKLLKNNEIENMINLLNEKTYKINEHIKKIENKIKKYDISNENFENDNKENFNNINQEINNKYDNIKKEIYDIKDNIKKLKF